MKKTSRKLTLDRQTVRDLGSASLRDVAGGDMSSEEVIHSCTPTACPPKKHVIM